MSKVEAEIRRFQKEIEKSESERNKLRNWERRKNSRNASMDSLLSICGDASPTPTNQSRFQKMSTTPRGMNLRNKFQSVGNISKLAENDSDQYYASSDATMERPPALPAKKSKRPTMSTPGSVVKKVSIAPDSSVRIMNASPSPEPILNGGCGPTDSLSNLPSVKDLKAKFDVCQQHREGSPNEQQIRHVEKVIRK